jgi:hypothetical protein
MIHAAIVSLALCGAPADYVLVVPSAPVAARDYVVIVRPARSVVVKRTVRLPQSPPTVIRRSYVAPPVIRYYEAEPTYYWLPSGFYSCPTCR